MGKGKGEMAQIPDDEVDHMVKAMRSLNDSYSGFNVDDFMRSIQTLSAWHQ